MQLVKQMSYNFIKRVFPKTTARLTERAEILLRHVRGEDHTEEELRAFLTIELSSIVSFLLRWIVPIIIRYILEKYNVCKST